MVHLGTSGMKGCGFSESRNMLAGFETTYPIGCSKFKDCLFLYMASFSSIESRVEGQKISFSAQIVKPLKAM